MGCFVAIPQDKLYILETCGEFNKIGHPGLNCVGIPGICTVVGSISTRIVPLPVNVESKTKDNVFVLLSISVQYRIKSDRVTEAFYTLENPMQQITSYVYDVVRATIPKMTIDEVFESKQDVAKDVFNELRGEMEKYGFEIIDTLIVDVQPDRKIRDSMNEINANKRLRQAATFKSEAIKISMVKAAEAEAESQFLQGVGIARQRKAVVEGMKNAVSQFGKDTGIEGKEATDLLLVSQYFDTLKDLAKQSNSHAIFYNEETGTEGLLVDTIRQGLMQGDAVDKAR